MLRRILIFILFGPQLLFAQTCVESGENVLCADSAPLADSLVSVPFTLGCFNSEMSYFTSFTTGTEGPAPVIVTITPGDCDDFTGPNEIFFTIVELSPGGDPCDPASYGTQSNCFGSDVTFSQQVNNLAANTTYLLIIGSDHFPAFGPCEFQVGIAGNAVDINTSVTPFLIYLGGTAQLNATNASSFTWSPPDYLNDPNIANPESTPEVTTAYTVSGQIGECTVSANATVTVGPPLIIYDGITPNNDGINDTWTILGIERFEANVITIFDRWGQQVFRSTGYPQPWDGTNRGNPLPMGAYYYVIELNSFEVEIPPITGVISIVK